MGKSRLEAFSDGVLAIIITIMVLELKLPHGAGLADLLSAAPVFLSYVLSYIYVGIYWNNHHHLIQASQKVTGGILWANLHLLFWLSLFPFVTAWMGENHFEGLPTAVYGVVLFMAAVAYYILERVIVRAHGPRSLLKQALGRDYKGMASPLLYATAIVTAFAHSWVSQLLYVVVALMWLVPDRRIERVFEQRDTQHRRHDTPTP